VSRCRPVRGRLIAAPGHTWSRWAPAGAALCLAVAGPALAQAPQPSVAIRVSSGRGIVTIRPAARPLFRSLAGAPLRLSCGRLDGSGTTRVGAVERVGAGPRVVFPLDMNGPVPRRLDYCVLARATGRVGDTEELAVAAFTPAGRRYVVHERIGPRRVVARRVSGVEGWTLSAAGRGAQRCLFLTELPTGVELFEGCAGPTTTGIRELVPVPLIGIGAGSRPQTLIVGLTARRVGRVKLTLADGRNLTAGSSHRVTADLGVGVVVLELGGPAQIVDARALAGSAAP